MKRALVLSTALLLAAWQRAAHRFGIKPVAQRSFRLSNDPREREQGNVRLLTSDRDYDAVVVLDAQGEFARLVPYQTVLPRPVLGSNGVTAQAWDAQWERDGAPQLSRRFLRKTNRPMGGYDWATWIAARAAAEAAAAFPKATLWVDRTEAAYWQGPDAEANTPKDLRFIVALARRPLDAYSAAGRLRTFEPADGSLPAGIEALATHGHTPGHASFLVPGGSGARDKLLVWGDLVHYHAVQFANPRASYEVDADRAQAIQSRRAMLQRAAREGWWVAGAHLPFPGLGHARVEGKGYAWVPAEYSPLPPAAP